MTAEHKRGKSVTIEDAVNYFSSLQSDLDLDFYEAGLRAGVIQLLINAIKNEPSSRDETPIYAFTEFAKGYKNQRKIIGIEESWKSELHKAVVSFLKPKRHALKTFDDTNSMTRKTIQVRIATTIIPGLLLIDTVEMSHIPNVNQHNVVIMTSNYKGYAPDELLRNTGYVFDKAANFTRQHLILHARQKRN